MLHHITVLIAVSTCFASATLRAAERPNIVLIMADDLGYGDVGCYNPVSLIPTPHLDRLAAQGMRFTDAHSPSSVCSPTRYALLTGRYSWRSRLQFGVLTAWSPPLISEDRLTIGRMLQQQGYRTACVGKWHLGENWATVDGEPPVTRKDKSTNVDFHQKITDGPTSRGFDVYFGCGSPNFPPYCFVEQDHTLGIPSEPSRPEFNRPGPMLPGWQWVDVEPALARRSVAFIHDAVARRPQQPFFLYVPFTAPHFPVVPSRKFQGTTPVGNYGDFVAQIDATVGLILAALDETGVTDNTLVVFTSDNGPEVTGEVKPGVYDRAEQFGHFSNGELRGAKRDLWEGGHRVPFIARWPGHVPPGTVSHALIGLLDVFATAADVLDAELSEQDAPDSVSFLPALTGKSQESSRNSLIHHSYSGRFAIRSGNWVLIEHSTGSDNGRRGETAWFREQRGYADADDHPRQLFDLDADPAQHADLFAERPEIAEELHRKLIEIVANGRSTPGPALANDVEVLIDKPPR